ncbi:MAG: SDR family oxidoreductase [Proteobacteria bacterium]|nr:SDR family oxidoreductase [Pseudomonadota bacterium]
MDLKLGNRNVLVTGSYRSTGQVIAERFAAEGARVFYHALDEETATGLRALTPERNILIGNITTDSGAAAILAQFRSAIDSLQPDDPAARELHVLVNNYGAADRGRWETSSTDDWVEAYQVNTLSAVRMIQHFTPLMSAGGRVINIGTIGSTRPNSIMPHYYAAKGALATLTVSLAKELGPRGITVNLVSPGLIRTPEVEARFMIEAKREGWGSDFDTAEAEITRRHFPNPLGRIATREEVADTVLFLAGQPAAFINGQNLRVDGGALDIV